MTVKYAVEDFGDFIEELKQVIPAHYDELCVAKDFPLDPNWEAYGRVYVAGMLKCITARTEDELVGYALFIVQPHIHYKTCKTAFEDVYFLKKEHRLGRTGIRLFQFAEEALRADGVNRVIMHTKIHVDNSRLFEYLGYKYTDKLYTKILSTEQS
jgi:GNAT superfamily N-acetyltransferase